MKLKKLFAISAIAGVALLASCNNGGETTTETKAPETTTETVTETVFISANKNESDENGLLLR